MNLTSGLRCLRESVRSVLSHVPVQKTYCHHSWGAVGRVGKPASSSRERLWVCGCWWLQPHCLHCGERNRCYSTSRKSWLLPVFTDGFALSSPLMSYFNFSRAVGSPLVMDPNTICRKAKRLAGKQAELCQTQPEIVREVAKGARLGVRECQYQFRYRRWNCTSHNKYFGKILQQGEWWPSRMVLLGESFMLFPLVVNQIVCPPLQDCTNFCLFVCPSLVSTNLLHSHTNESLS